MDEYYRTYRASTHRGLYRAAERATEAYERARGTIAQFIGADADEVVFTAGATAASNMLTYALEQTLAYKETDEIIVSSMEHHASLIPLQELAHRKGFMLRHIPVTAEGALDHAAATTLIGPHTKIVSVMLASNVTGAINDVASIAKLAHAAGAVMIVDATAAVGHIAVDVRALGADFLYFSGHKMCGPTGVGVLYGTREWLGRLQPGFFGGGMIDDVTKEGATWVDGVERFEAGTQNIAGVIGLGRAVEYLSGLGLADVHTHSRELVAYAQERLATVDGVTLFSAPPATNVGIVSFTLAGVHPHDVAQVCADRGVAVRAGHHCALPFHRALGVPATTRASVYVYNTEDDVNMLVSAVRSAREIFSGS